MDESILIDQFPRFFEDARLNFAENILAGNDANVAVIDIQEESLWSPRKYTWRQLRDTVALYVGALHRLGLERNGVVAGTSSEIGHGLSTKFRAVIGSNCVRSLALLLATAAMGGVFASFATDIGEKVLRIKHLVLL